MGLNKRYQKNKSIEPDAKSFAENSLAAFFFLSICSIFVACSQSPKQTLKLPPMVSTSTTADEPISSPDFEITSLGLQLTRTGINDSPSASPDGKKMVYVSRGRPGHAHGQVYLLDLETRKEKRITFQDGDCFNPVFLKDGKHIAYASTTDELKERPLLFQKKLEPNKDLPAWPPADLYVSDLTGTEIQRLTTRNGFDGLPWPRNDKSLTYSQANGGLLEAWQINSESKNTLSILAKKTKSIENLRFSPDEKQAVWIERSPDQLMRSSSKTLKAGEALKLPPGSYRDVSWIANHKILFSAQVLKNPYLIYSYDLKAKCLQQLVESSDNLFSPQMTSGGAALVFSGQNGNKSQIYYKSFTTSDQCLKWEEIEVQNGLNGKTSSLKEQK